jgi:cell division protein FtsB
MNYFKNKKFLLYLGMGFMGILLLQMIFSDNGVLDLRKKYAERKYLLQRDAIIKQENAHLYHQVYRLRNDPAYIESIARRELGMIREDEIIFKFKLAAP